MTIKEIYESGNNSLPDDLLKRLISKYSDNEDIFYSKLVRMNSKDRSYFIPSKERSEFSNYLFDIFKNSILKINPEEIVDDRVEIFSRYLKQDPNIKYEDFMSVNFDDRFISEDEIADISSLQYYIGYLSPDDRRNSYWHQVESGTVNFKDGIDYHDIRHRLYIHADDEVTYPLYKEFINKCLEKDIPFIFKYPSKMSEKKNGITREGIQERDDVTVIYSDEKHLSEYIDILQEIRKEHPEFMSHIGEPPILSQKIDNWIGYGSEPQDHNSFNSTRAKILYEEIKQTKAELARWKSNNRHNKNYQKYLCKEMLNISIEKLESQNIPPSLRKFLEMDEGKEKLLQKFNTSIGKLIELNEKIDRVKAGTDIYFNKSKEEVLSSLNKEIERLNIKFGSGSTDNILAELSINDVLKEAEKKELTDENIFRMEPQFLSNLRNRIRQRYQESGIDPKNTAFATYISKGIKKDVDDMFKEGTGTKMYDPDKKSY